jgi:hypothetical protein
LLSRVVPATSTLKLAYVPVSSLCYAPECDKNGNRKGLCSSHYNQKFFHKIKLRPLRGQGKPVEASGGYLQVKKRDHPNAKKNGIAFLELHGYKVKTGIRSCE